MIYKPSTSVAGRAVLDPNSDGYTSANSAGFSSSDFGTASELKMVAIPQLDLEPSGDLATGSSGGHTDMVDASTNKKSVFVMSDGTNLIIRFRIGNASTASKGYSLLIDTDGTFAGTGANLGFEQEIVLETGTNGRIAVYNHTSVVGTLTSSYNIDEHQQRSVALTTDGSNPDYFYDFFVPLSAISGSPVRFAAVTITSAGSGIVGTISDVNGVNDLQYNSNVPAMLKAVIASFPPTSLTTLTTGATFSEIKTTTPYISSSQLTTSTSVSGTSSEPNGTTITVYKGGISIGTTTVISNAWSLTGIAGGTFAAGNAITAKAQDISAGKSLSDVSNTVVVGQVCTSAPVITGEVNGAKGYTGSWTPLAGQSITANTIRIYIHGISAETAMIGGKNFVTGEAFTITTDYNGNPVYVLANPTVGASSTWSFQLFNQGNSVPNGTFWATAENIGTGSCVSITSNLQYRTILATTAPVITSSPVYDTYNQVTGTKATNAKLIFYVNGVERLTISASPNSTSWTATGLNLVVGDKLTAKAIVDGTSGLSDASNEVTVQDQLNGTAVAPDIKGTYNNTQTSISGTSSEAPGTVITVFKNGVSIGTATVTIFGAWTLTGITLQTGNLLTAKATAENKNESVLSATVTVLGPTNSIPAVNSPIYANSSSIGGTLASETLKVYIDGEPLNPALSSQSGIWTYSNTQLASLASELYAGAQVKATNTEAGKLESAQSSGVTVIGVNNFLVEKAGGGNIAVQTAGIAFPIRITARDASNSTFTTYTNTNVLSTGSTVSSGAGPTFNFTSGVLSTHNITLTKAGSYSLTTIGSDNPGVSGTSNIFVINPSTPARLEIFQQASATGTSEVTFAQQPKIYVYDQFGNHVTTDNTTQVTVSIASGTGTLNGLKTLTATNGIITFSGLNINGSGVYTLQFAAAGLTSVTSSVITITASTPPVPSSLSYNTPNTFNTGAAISALNPTVTGTVASYSVDPALPTGLTLNAGTGIISGTPTVAVAQSAYTVTATNSGGSTNFVITITITGGAAPVASVVAISGTTTVGQTLTGSYTFTDADGDLQGTSTFRWLSSTTADGIYTAIGGATSSTYVLVAADQGKFIKYEVTPVAATGSPISGTAVLSSATAAIQSANANLPVFTYASPQTLTKSFALAVLSPVNTGGAVISYTISPELPAGLRFNTSTGEITGTPAGISPQSTYVVTGTNSQGSIAFNLVIKINDVAPLFTYSSPQTYTKGASIKALSPLNTGGAVLFYSVNPLLPAGLNINSTSGLITGTPAAASAQKTYFVSGTNSGGTATFEVVIGVKESLPVVAYTNPLIFILGSNSNVSPVNAGGSVSSYSLNKPLPSGLILNTTTGTISGIPEKLSESSSFLLTATNASGSSSFNFTIEVQPAKPKLEILLFATNPVKQSDGSFSINYRIRIANLGNTHLSNLAMAIDLNKVFPAPVKFQLIGTPKSSGSGVISNSIFNGVSNFNLLSSVDQPESNMAVQNTFDEPRYLAGDLNKEDLMGILLSPERLNSFKDATLNNLVFGSSQLAMSDTASVTFIVNIMPNGHMGPYSMEVLGTAESPAGEVVSESSTDGRLVINTGITSVKYPTIVSLLPNSQIASSLNVQEVIRIDDNSYDVKFRAKLINSGNLNLSKVKLLADLKKQFRASSTFRITDFVFVQNEGIVRNYLFDGSSITNLLTSESAISVNKEDVLDFTINLNPNGTYGDYSLQLTAEAFSFDLDESISVKSASGLDPMSSLLNPANNLASVFTIAAPGPRNLLLDNDLIDENNSLNALVGKMSAIDVNSAAVLSYSLVSGSGDTDNNNFSFSGSSLLAVQVLDYEKVSSYSIRVRVSNHFSQFTEKNFTIRVKDVNELPTLDAIADLRLFSTTGQQTIALNNLTAGPEASQKVTATVRVDNETLFDNIAIVGNQLRYNIKGGVAGKVNITITVIDDGDLLSGGAKSIERSFNLTIDPLPTISAEPLIISKGFTSNLRVISSAPATYAWSPSTGLSRTDIPNPVARPLQTTTYTVTVINQFGFSINLNVTITVNEDFNLMIPNVFSPNGDRQNDLWVIENIESYPDHELTILDRSGRVLKKVKNYQNDWDGLANGLPLEEGTYYYTIRFIEKNVLKKGFVTLVR